MTKDTIAGESEELRERLAVMERILAGVVRQVGGRMLLMPDEWHEWLKSIDAAQEPRT